MTNNAVITILMALGMSLDDADTSFDMYCDFYGELPNKINNISSMWWIYSKTNIYHEIYRDNF